MVTSIKTVIYTFATNMVMPVCQNFFIATDACGFTVMDVNDGNSDSKFDLEAKCCLIGGEICRIFGVDDWKRAVEDNLLSVMS